MKVTFFRILSLILLTFSCSAMTANAQYSVCCPASDADCALPENQCNDYLEAGLNQPSVENWIDRVSNALQNYDANRRLDSAAKTAPNAAAPIDVDCFRTGPCGGFSTGTVATESSAEQSARAGNLQARGLMILRASDPAQAAPADVDTLAAATAEQLTKRLSTWSLVSHLQQRSAQQDSYWDAVKSIDYSANTVHAAVSEPFSYWDAVKSIDYSTNTVHAAVSEPFSYWDAVKSIDYSTNTVHAAVSEPFSYWDAVKSIDYSANTVHAAVSEPFSYWDAVKSIDYSANTVHAAVSEEHSFWNVLKNLDYSGNMLYLIPSTEISYWDAVNDLDYSGNISPSVMGSALSSDDHVSNNTEPGYSQYDLYDVEASYLYGCFGYESIYGFKASEDTAEVAVPLQSEPTSDTGQITSGQTAESAGENQSSSAPFGADFDGYLPYDVIEDQIDREDPFEAAGIEVIQKQTPQIEVIGQKTESEINCPFEHQSSRSVSEFAFTLDELTLLPQLLQHYVDRFFHQFHRWDIVDSGWQINNRLEMALCGSESLTVWRDAIWAHQMSQEVAAELEIAEARREKILSIAQTLDVLADRLKAASANLVSLAERESHKLIGRRISAHLNR